MNDLSAGRITEDEEERLLSEARRRLHELSEHVEFDPMPYEEIVRLLESLPPPTGFADGRVQVAWEIVLRLGPHLSRSLGLRALYASFPVGSKLRDRVLERRWMTAAGVLEMHAGNAQRTLKFRASAVKLAKEIGDVQGQASELSNLALLLNGSGRHEEAIEVTDAVARQMANAASPELVRSMCINRGNAFFRLGRLEEAVSAIACGVAAVEPPVTGRTLYSLVTGQAALAEVLIELNRIAEARGITMAAMRLADRSRMTTVKFDAARPAALLRAVSGDVPGALDDLRSLLQEARAQGGGVADGPLLDVLHAIYRTYRRIGDRDAAIATLREIGDAYLNNAGKVLHALRHVPEASDLVRFDAKMREIDRYLDLKTVELGAVSEGNLRNWSYLVSAAATASAIEDASIEHCPRVARLARHVAERLGEPHDSVAAIEAGALLHDVGKLGVADIILRKTGSLDDQEAELYAAHAEAGAQLLERADIPHKRMVIEVARHHHKSYDGRGAQSANVLGEAIPLAARIVAVCDFFDALVMGRPRRGGVSVQEALKELLRLSGRDFDPRVVEIFIETVRQLQAEHDDVMQYLSDAAGEIDYFATQRMLRRAVLGATA